MNNDIDQLTQPLHPCALLKSLEPVDLIMYICSTIQMKSSMRETL